MLKPIVRMVIPLAVALGLFIPSFGAGAQEPQKTEKKKTKKKAEKSKPKDPNVYGKGQRKGQ